MIPTVTVDKLMMEEREISLFTWCDDPHDRTVEVYADPVAALQAGLRRAAYPTPANGTHETRHSGGQRS